MVRGHKPTGKPLQVAIAVRLSPTIVRVLHHRARKAGLTLGVYVKKLLELAASKPPSE